MARAASMRLFKFYHTGHHASPQSRQKVTSSSSILLHTERTIKKQSKQRKLWM